VLLFVKGVYTGDLYSDLIAADPGVKERDHPWEQPQDVIDALVARLAPRTGLTICDPMCGTGTTGIAAIRAGCRAVLSDVDPACVRLSKQRCADALAALPTDA
jgi:site-specific DNA-methyltransferase (adenine-specific)